MRANTAMWTRLVTVALGLFLAGCAAAPGSGTPSASLEPTRTLLVDTDVAPDDIAALAFLLKSPRVEIAAITVSGTGEAHCRGGVDVVLRLLERLDAPMIPVACGRETPLAGNHAFPDPWRDGADSGSGLELPATAREPFPGTAVDLIAETGDAVNGLQILTLGPLTNLADALGGHPALTEQIESVYVMGGALHVPGNLLGSGAPLGNQVAEWNIYIDPHAAAIVVNSGLQIHLISLDGTNQVPVTREFAQRVQREATGPAALVLAELFAGHPFMTDGSYYLWDPLAAALAAGYSVGTFSVATVSIEESEGPEAGFTRPGAGSSNVEYLSTGDRVAAENTLLGTLNRS